MSQASGMKDWTEIVREYGPIVWNTSYRILNHDSDVADVFQNAFLAAWEYSQEATINSWPGLLRRLATVESLKRMRQRYRDKTVAQPIMNEYAVDADPRVAVEGNELANRLRDALAAIDPRQAEVYCLACFDGMKYQEIGEALGITTNHVGVLLNRARSQLRAALKDFEVAKRSSKS